MNQVRSFTVKSEWQELNEDDRTDIAKFDKYLSELLGYDKVSGSNYELIMEYIFGRAYLAKFIAIRLNMQSSSTAKNKQRIMFLINKMILEKDSERKQVILSYLDQYLSAIYVNIFKEYNQDETTKEKFKMMRLCWVEKISAETIEKMRKDIGDLLFSDIDVGLSRESVEKVKQFYKNNNIDPNIYLKRAMEQLQKTEMAQQTTSVHKSSSNQEKVSEKPATEKPKKKPPQPSGQGVQTVQQPQKQNTSVQQQQQNQQSAEEKKKVKQQQQQQKRKNSNNIETQPSVTSSQPNKILQTGTEIYSQNQNMNSQQQNKHNILQQYPSSKNEEVSQNEGDIQIKKKPKKIPQQLGILGLSGQAMHFSPQNQQRQNPITQQKPIIDDISGNTLQKKLKTSKNEPNQQVNYNPSHIRPPQHQQQQQVINPPPPPPVVPQRLPDKVQAEKVKKLVEESNNLKTASGVMLMPTTMSLGYGYGYGSFNEPEIQQPPSPPSHQQPQFPSNPSSQGQIQAPVQELSSIDIPQNKNLLNNLIPPPPPPLPVSQSKQINQKILKNQQLIDSQLKSGLPNIPKPPPLPQNPLSQIGNQQDYGLNNSQQNQQKGIINKQQQQQQQAIPPQNLNYQTNLQHSQNSMQEMNQMKNQQMNPIKSQQINPIQNQQINPIQNQQQLLNQNMNSSSNIERPQDMQMQNQSQNQPMNMLQRVVGSGPLENQQINTNIMNRGTGNIPFQQPPPPPPPIHQQADQNQFQNQMDIEPQNQSNPIIMRKKIQQQPPFSQTLQTQHNQPQPPPLFQQNLTNINPNKTRNGSSQNLNSSNQMEQLNQPHNIIPFQQPPPPPGFPMRQMSQSNYNLLGIQQDKTTSLNQHQTPNQYTQNKLKI